MGGKPAAEARFEDIYQLGKELGHGSFSTVREGVHKVGIDRVTMSGGGDESPESSRGLKICTPDPSFASDSPQMGSVLLLWPIAWDRCVAHFFMTILSTVVG